MELQKKAVRALKSLSRDQNRTPRLSRGASGPFATGCPAGQAASALTTPEPLGYLRHVSRRHFAEESGVIFAGADGATAPETLRH